MAVITRPARAAQLQFMPIMIEAPLGSFATTLDVANRGGGSSTLQVRAFRWSQSPNGDDPLTASDAIVVSPPMFTLPDSQTQTIRILLHTEPGPTEDAFRILVDEIPQIRNGLVQMALRVSLPVFAAPPDARPDLHWSIAAAGPGRLVVTVRNNGQRHARISKVTLARAGRTPVEGRLLSRLPYVLAGSERSWAVALAGAVAGDEVHLVADTDPKPLALSLAIGP